MHGSYLSWLYQYLAGINITSRTTVTIKPYRPTGLASVSASVQAPRGTVTVGWDATAITITIPPGMTGTYLGTTLQSGTTVINF
jgi:ribosome recycling factor